MLRPLIALATLALLGISSSHAEYIDPPKSEQDKPLSFWVYFNQTRSDWDIGDLTADTKTGRIGFGFAQKFNSRVKGGLFLGYSTLDQDDNPPADDIGQAGGHIGLMISGLPYNGERFKIDTGGSIAYNRVTGDKQEQDVETRWTEGLIYLKGTATLKPVILSLGGNYQYISGTEKLTGTPLTENNDIKSNKNLSALAGIDVMFGGGTIGFHGEWGARNSFALVFARDF